LVGLFISVTVMPCEPFIEVRTSIIDLRDGSLALRPRWRREGRRPCACRGAGGRSSSCRCRSWPRRGAAVRGAAAGTAAAAGNRRCREEPPEPPLPGGGSTAAGRGAAAARGGATAAGAGAATAAGDRRLDEPPLPPDPELLLPPRPAEEPAATAEEPPVPPCRRNRDRSGSRRLRSRRAGDEGKTAWLHGHGPCRCKYRRNVTEKTPRALRSSRVNRRLAKIVISSVVR
jgi:hypothetical protein